MIYIYAGIAFAIIILILLLPYLFKSINKDHFDQPAYYYPDQDPELYDPSYDTHTNFAFWNTQRGTRRGMSYDLRGDAGAPIGQRMWVPFNMSTSMPIVNKPLY